MADEDANDLVTVLSVVAGVVITVVLCVVAQIALCPNP